MTSFNLEDLQNEMLGEAHNLILPENIEDRERELKQMSIRKIVSLYSTSRKGNKVFKSTYDALHDSNPWTRMAAADIICKYGNTNSFEYLFKALEDEENSKIKQKIANSITVLETRLNHPELLETVNLRDVTKLLKYD
ncbi:MAG: HEAT repeat domain-containing protein [Candidatus Heimdallarchaeota archaeon]|nr:HEAT repeat domain-containing protein [Candidatus Heimdallarchaeota archaeon]